MLKKGDKIYFGRPYGEKTLAKITKVNQKTYSVETLESRGARGKKGQKWRVPFSLATKAGAGKKVGARAGKRTKKKRNPVEERLRKLARERGVKFEVERIPGYPGELGIDGYYVGGKFYDPDGKRDPVGDD